MDEIELRRFAPPLSGVDGEGLSRSVLEWLRFRDEVPGSGLNLGNDPGSEGRCMDDSCMLDESCMLDSEGRLGCGWLDGRRC